MSINEIPSSPKPKSGGILERMAMHGVDQSRPAKEADDGLRIFLGPNNTVMGVGADPKRFPGHIKAIKPPRGMDLDNLPDVLSLEDDDEGDHEYR